MWGFFLEEKVNVLITGASRGIGFNIALEFIKRGNKVFGVGRNWENFDEKKYEGNFIPIKCDVSVEKERENLFNYFKEKNISIDILVNNAGIGSIGEFKNISWEESNKLIELNITSLTHMTKLFLDNINSQEKSEKRGIINLSSTASFQSGGPYANVYYASKTYVKSFSLALSEELSNKNIRVMCLCPGPVKTDFKGMKEMKKSFYIMTPEEVGKIAVKDYFNNKIISIPGYFNKFFVFLSKFIPKKLELKIIKRIQIGKI